MKTPIKTQSGLAFLLTLVPFLSPAANLTWDANSGTAGAQDGSGTWDTTTPSWWTGAANAAFVSGVPDVPTFGSANGVAGTVTLGTNVIAANIFFNPATVGHYVIAGGTNTLALTNRTIAANSAATIAANIVGAQVLAAHSTGNNPIGVLTLSGTNSFTGGFVLGPNDAVINGGPANSTTAVRANSSFAFGTGAISFNTQGNASSPRLELTGGINITNAINAISGRNNPAQAIESFSGANILSGPVTTGAGGSQYPIQVDGASTLTIAGNLTIQASGGRAVVLRGSGNGTVSGIISGGPANTNTLVKTGTGSWTFSGANTFNFPTVAVNGTLALDYSAQNNSKLSDAYGLYLAGGVVSLNGGSHTEVVGSNIVVGASTITRPSGTSTVRLNGTTRLAGGTVDFAAASLADTDALNVNGILGGYATVGGANWAINSTGLGDGPITAYSAYSDIAALGSTIADGAANNVRLNSAGAGGNIVLGAATTTVNTLLQNTTTAATINNAGGILRLGATGGVLIPSGSQSLTIGTAVDSGTVTAGGADNTPGELILINNSASALTVNSIIADNGSGVVSVNKSGSGAATLAGNNTHTGTNFVTAGTLNISSSANLGSGTVVVNNGTLNATASTDLGVGRTLHVGPAVGYGAGTIGVNSGVELIVSGPITMAPPVISGAGGIAVAGGLIKTGAGNLILAAVNTYNFGTTINGGTVTIFTDSGLGSFDGPARNGAQPCYQPDNIVLNSGTLLASNTFALSANRGVRLGPINGSGSGTIAVSDGNILTFGGQISDNWAGLGSLVKADTGNLTLTGSVSDFSGNTTVNAGTLQLNNSRALPNGAGKGNVIINSGATLAINGVNVALNGVSGAGTVDNVSANAMTFSVGNNNQSGTLSGAINNSGGGPLSLAKAGTGTLTLSGASSYSGSTLVGSGTLALTGAASISSSTNIVVGSGATFNVTGLTASTLVLNSGQVLSGVGSVVGNIDSGAGAIAPGTSAGTLPITGNLVLSGGSLNYELANITTTGAGVNDLTTVSGNLTIAGPTTLNLTYLNALPASSGKYTLITYGGSFVGNVNDIVVPSGFTISHNVGAKAIELVINHVPVSLTWRGDGAGNVWDINATANWNANTTTFFNGDTANFDNTGSNTPAILISGTPIAAGVNVNASQDYTFTSGDLTTATLTKSGAGVLTLDNSVTAGVTTINGGTVQIGTGATTGALFGGNITNNGVLIGNRSDAVTLTNQISGSGAISQISLGATVLFGSNSYAGLTTISSGSVYVANGAALGSTNAGTIVSSGAALYITQNVDVGNEALTLSGEGIAADGALRKGGGGVSIYGGAVTLLADSRINIDGNATLNLTNSGGISGNANLILSGGGGSQGTVSGPVVLAGGGGTLTKTGSGTWTLGGANQMALNAIDNGTLVLANNGALGTNKNVVLTSTTGGPGLSGTRLTLAGGVSFDATRSLTMPSAGAGSVRSALFGTGAGVTNTWAGAVTLLGDTDPGNFIGLGAENNSTLLISGNVTADSSFAGRFFLRGNGSGGGSTGTGIIAGTIALNPTTGSIQAEDGSTWILASSGHTWVTTFFANSSRLILGANNALPVGSAITINSGANNRLDLNGFNQSLSTLEMAVGLNITNSSSSGDSTLTYASAGSSTYPGTIRDGTRKLNVSLTTGTLILTNANSLSVPKSTLSIAASAALQLNFVGTNTVNALVLNGVSQPGGLYNVLNASPYITGVGNILVVPGPSGPATLTNIVSGNTLSLTWPAGQGWRLQAQTNSLTTGLSNNWVYLTDGSVSSTNIAVNPANPTVFYRLAYP